ncbi:hypothetical protein [Sphingosinithalassobacter sp. CS137]|uniref:hypothetical protein n=1 Tax=Sphingosinithalassobacter sp. CS137 TaxID=2762748 RepID=UPI00165EA536|nr:hypothetical protein [Sphingosinithalassobacter sp. CS137]
MGALSAQVRNWRANWRHGTALAEAEPQAEAVADAIEQRLRTGRPLATEEWIAKQEARTGLAMAKRKPGPKATAGN